MTSPWFPALLALFTGAFWSPPRQAPAAARTAAAAAAEDPLPMPSSGLSIPAPSEDGPKALWLVEELARIGGVHVMASGECRRILERIDLGLFGPVEVPPEQVWSFAEGLLIANNFCLQVLRVEEPRLVRVSSLDTNERNAIRSSSLVVPMESIALYTRHPAQLVTTVLTLPHTDVRTLSNSMRTMLTDANTQQIIPVGASNSLILTGFGPSIASLVEVLRKVDAESAAHPPAQAPGGTADGAGH
jgi:hypothetical protein